MSRAAQIDPSDAWDGSLAPLAADLERVARRLRGLTEARLRRRLPPYGTVAGAGRHLAEHLAGAAAAAEGTEHRELPILRDTAVGDQVAVTGHDLLGALAALTPDTPVRTAAGECRAADLAAAAYTLTREVKLAVD